MPKVAADRKEETETNRARNPLRQGPRSKIVEAIAVLLLARPMRVAEIAQILGKSPRYISSYLSYWRTRGLFDYENGYWTLTSKGEEFARTILEREMNTRVAQYAALARQIIEAEQVRAAINSEKQYYGRMHSGGIQRFIDMLTNYSVDKTQKAKPLYSCARALLEDPDLDEDEKQVLEYMLRHYAKWKTTYTYTDQLARELDADNMWLLQVLRRLQSKGFIYIYNDRRLGMRIGLSKKVRQILEACSEA